MVSNIGANSHNPNAKPVPFPNASASINLLATDCGNEFVFTEGEQAFYAEKGFTNEPKRCPECRKARKQQRYNKNQEN